MATHVEPSIKRLGGWVFLFSLISLVFIILLVFLRVPFPLYSLISDQDALDFLTPLLLIPVYWILFRFGGSKPPSLLQNIAFLALSVIWLEGHAMHLAANSINNLIGALAKNNQLDVTGSEIYRLTYFFDEELGHYLWHIGMFGLAALLIFREWQSPAGLRTSWFWTVLSGIIYGATLFMFTIEGQTVWLGLPFVLLVTIFVLLRERKNLNHRPLLAFFFVAGALALLCYVAWYLRWGGFPEFSKVGLI